jgi:UDP-N-acetylglucosamine--N-acetylmuramyl-(pentapeptide) pyrophosphoryl-undecaprenol N-acetylglucosamine transferase
MRAIISAGGTGGHIYPALAILNKIKEHEPDSEFLYIGTHNRMEKDIVPNKGIPFESIEIYGFDRHNLLRNFKVIRCLMKSKSKVKNLIKNFNPDIVIGVGGYVTVPVISCAKKLGYKTFIHEQNSIPGKANKYLIKYSDKIGISMKSTLKDFPEDKVVFTGNPCSEDALKKEPMDKTSLGLHDDKKLVLIVMGSLGASTVNKVMVEALPNAKSDEYEVVFVTGKKDYDEISTHEFPENIKVVPYIDGMAGLMKKTDLIITRAGASTLSEIIALKVPSILIPSPYVPNNHQYINAMDLVNVNAADILEEKDLNASTLINKMTDLLNNQDKLNEMKNNLSQLGIDNSAEKIYSIIKELIEGK